MNYLCNSRTKSLKKDKSACSAVSGTKTVRSPRPSVSPKMCEKGCFRTYYLGFRRNMCGRCPFRTFPLLGHSRLDRESRQPLVPEPPVAKTSSCASYRNICPLAKWGMEQLGAYKGDFATRTSDLKRGAGTVWRSAEGRRLHAGFSGLARCREGA